MSLVRTRWSAIGAAVALTLGAGGIGLVAATSPDEATAFVPIEPCRIVDTRPDAQFNVGPRNTPLDPDETYSIHAHGDNGECVGIPTSAAGLALNVTAVTPTQATFLTLWGTGDRPNASHLNPAPGQPPTPNAVTTELTPGGEFNIFNRFGNVHVLADVVGYYTDHDHDDRYYTKIQVDTGLLQGPPGPQGPPGDTGTTGLQGPVGPVGPVNRTSDQQIALLQWYQDPGAAAIVAVGPEPYGVAFDGTSVWVTNSGSNNVSKIDPATNTVAATVAVGSFPYGVAFDGTSIWVTNRFSANVSKIDPATDTVTATISVGSNPDGEFPAGVAFDGTSIWVTNYGSDLVSEIDPATNTVTATVTVGSNPNGVAFDGTSIWVTNWGSGNVSKINPATNTVAATIAVGSNPNGVAFDGTSVWVANNGSNNVSKINPATNSGTATVTVGSNPIGVAFNGTNIWVTNNGSDNVSKIIPF